MTLPFVGHPTGAKNSSVAAAPEDKVESAYWFLVSDFDAVRQECAHSVGTWWDQRIYAALRDCGVLVR
jgi:hypothetical protein